MTSEWCLKANPGGVNIFYSGFFFFFFLPRVIGWLCYFGSFAQTGVGLDVLVF